MSAAYAVFSLRDAVGNRVTGIDAGAILEIDVLGPEVIGPQISPPAPVRNDP